MKWVPMSERKPPLDFSGDYWFTDGKDTQLDKYSFVKDWATHWLEFSLPPLPKKVGKEDKLKDQIISHLCLYGGNPESRFICGYLTDILEILKTKADK